MPSNANENKQTFGIGAAAKLSGLSDHIIRVWERRYEAVVAHRTANGRRVYTSKDVEKLSLLKALTERGMSIGRIAHESLEQLRKRAQTVSELAVAAAPSRINTAILGDFLPGEVHAARDRLESLSVVALESNRERFAADLEQQAVDVLVLEVQAADVDTLRSVRNFQDICGANRAVLVYHFASTTVVAQLRNAGLVVLRAPVTVEEVEAAVVRACVGAGKRRKRPPAETHEAFVADEFLSGPIEPRRFTQEQLANLANVSSTIECECPQHLAQLVGALSAFEVYSANCANRNDQDAALHRYLHRTTASARAMIEAALERVAVAEGLLR